MRLSTFCGLHRDTEHSAWDNIQNLLRESVSGIFYMVVYPKSSFQNPLYVVYAESSTCCTCASVYRIFYMVVIQNPLNAVLKILHGSASGEPWTWYLIQNPRHVSVYRIIYMVVYTEIICGNVSRIFYMVHTKLFTYVVAVQESSTLKRTQSPLHGSGSKII